MTVHPDSPAQSTRGESRSARKVGYLVAVLVNVIMLVIVNIRPGWQELSFLTGDFAGILWLVNLSMAFSAMVNLVYLWYDPAWFKSVSQVATSAISLAASLRILQVFPFDFSAYSFDWSALTRLALVLAIFGTAVSIVVELVRLASHGVSAGNRSQPLHHT
jgi:uncharacterized membrane protein